MPHNTLPPGEYWIGDPCYVIPRPDWNQFLDDIDPETRYTQHRGQTSVVFDTYRGDGSYQDQNGRQYSVDSGIIAAVPVELVKQTAAERASLNDLGQWLTTDRTLVCDTDGYGTLTFGDLSVMTGDPDEDEEDDDEDEDEDEDEEDS